MQYVKIESTDRVMLDFLRCANARTFRSAKRQNTQLCCIGSIFIAVFHILFH
jgi:hypothetical protein